MREQEFQLHGREESAWTSVTAGAEVHVDAIDVGKIRLVAAVRGGIFTHFEVSQPVEFIWMGSYFGIE